MTTRRLHRPAVAALMITIVVSAGSLPAATGTPTSALAPSSASVAGEARAGLPAPAVMTGDGPVANGSTAKGFQAVLLYDQTNLTPTLGVAAQNFEASLDPYDCEGADDFVVDATGGWLVEQVFLPGSYSPEPPGGPATSVGVSFYLDGGGRPGTLACASQASVISDQGGTLLVQLGTPCFLEQGTYWLGAQANMDFDPYGQWYWGVSPDQVGAAGRWRNPGDGFLGGCVDWGPIIGCTSLPEEIDYLFQILGTAEGAGQTLPTDGSWTPFSWTDGPGVFNSEGPFTFSVTSAGYLDVTDAFIAGDQFEVYDFDSMIGTTSYPQSDTDATEDPDVAFADPRWSSGSFQLGPGEHSITVRVIRIAPGHPEGGAFMRWRFEEVTAPVADFSWTPQVPGPGQEVQFSDQSLNQPDSWLWDFGDGTGSVARNPRHTFTGAGSYQVTLTVTNSAGPDSLTQELVVGQPPTVSFTWSPVQPTVGEPVQFTDASPGQPTSWSWTFGDGFSSFEPNPVHTYAMASPMPVTLTVSNAFGSDQGTLVVTVLDLPGGEIIPGPEQQASPTGVDPSSVIASATDRQGNRVIVWKQGASKRLGAGSQMVTQTGSIFGRLFDPNDVPSEIFEVGSGDDLKDPTASFDAAGNFICGWEKNATTGQSGVFGRVFGPDQQPLGAAFQVDEGLGGEVDSPFVAANNAGEFTMVWRQTGGKVLQSGGGIFGRPFNPDGSPAGPSVRLDDAGPGVNEISIPAVAADATGNFFVVWHQRAVSKLQQDGDGVFARRLDPSGSPSGEPFLVNDLPTGEPGDPEVAVDAQGDAVVVWKQDIGGDAGVVICGRKYDRQGQPATGVFLVNSETAGSQVDPSVAVNPAGKSATAWVSTAGGSTSIFGRFFNAEGQPLGGDFLVASQQGAVVPGAPKVSIASDDTVTVAYTKGSGPSTAVYYRTFDVITAPTVCQPGPTTMCLNDERFQVEVGWRDFSNNTGVGRAVPVTSDTGYFWFFNDANVELMIKVLDGTALNGNFWVFYGALSNVEYTITVTDTQSGSSVTYFNPSGSFASVGDTAALPGGGGKVVHRFEEIRTERPGVGASLALPRDEVWRELLGAEKTWGNCAPGSENLCLNQSRFRVDVGWRDFAGNTGVGEAVSLTGDTGYFWFFNDDNIELIVKVLDGRAINDHFWVFYGALSNVQYTLRVTDTETGQFKDYTNSLGSFGSVGDTEAFLVP